MGKTLTPEQREAKNAAARAKRAAAKVVEAPEVADAVVINEPTIADVAVSGPVKMDIREIEEGIAANAAHAEQFVDNLITAQSAADASEHTAILAMVAEIRAKNATVEAFISCYAERASLRGMKASVVKVRKSQLKGVLTSILEDEAFESAFLADGSCGLQAAYKLRQELNKPEGSEGSDGADDGDDGDDAAPVSADAALVKMIKQAIECADVAKRDEIADDLRDVLTKLMVQTGAIAIAE
jgi:hypothetical protein